MRHTGDFARASFKTTILSLPLLSPFVGCCLTPTSEPEALVCEPSGYVVVNNETNELLDAIGPMELINADTGRTDFVPSGHRFNFKTLEIEPIIE